MIPKTTTWICDACGDTVESVADGWVQWLTIKKDDDSGYRCEGLQLVHAHRPNKPKCIYDGQRVFRTKNATTADLALKDFSGPDGMMRLLSFISEDEFDDKKEVVEIIKRIFILGYEQVRLHLDRATSEGAFEPNTAEGFPHQFQIQAVIDWLEANETEG